MFIVVTNVVASQTPTARAKIVLVVPLLPTVTSMLSKAQLYSARWSFCSATLQYWKQEKLDRLKLNQLLSLLVNSFSLAYHQLNTTNYKT